MQIKQANLVRVLGFLSLAAFVALPEAHAQVKLPDVIIGDPNDPSKDVAGEPISERELHSSPEPETGNIEGENDPITQSGFFQGDIVVATEDHLYQIIEGAGDIQTSAVRNPSLRWANGVVPYIVSSSFSNHERNVIGRAMQAFHSTTCIQFTPRQPHHYNYIHILKGRGCSSSVGRIGGVQVVSLGVGCNYYGIVIHEFMHAIGFWHEQSRADRDEHVTINWSNITPNMKFNFDKKSNWVTHDLGQSYDYSSVMHYGAYDFALNPYVPTITPKVRGVTIGQRKGFSQMDIEGINKLYQCDNVISTTTRPTPRPPIRTTYRPFSTAKPKPWPKPTPKPKPSLQCYDADKSCWAWAQAGRCDKSPSLKKFLCKKSCGTCEPKEKCTDHHASCGYWKSIGECLRNPNYMNYNCRASCGTCM